MAAPLLTRRRVLVAKIESVVGTAETLAAADGVFNIFEPEIQPDIEFVEREGQGTFSPLPGAMGAHGGTATFSIELTGGSTPPAWATTFLPAAGFGIVSTGNIYRLSALPPEAAGSGTKTLTIGAWISGRRKMLHGCMGNAVFTFTAGKPVMIEFTFTGLWNAVADVANPAPTYPTTAPLRFVSTDGVTIGSVKPHIAEMTIDLGNTVVLRESPNTLSGYHSAVITGRTITGSMDPEAHLVADYDPYGDFLARTERALAITLGGAGNGVAFAAPKFQITSVPGGDREGLATDNIEFQLNRSASAGDDDLTITFS
jgi:hypothetical protein